MHLAHLPDVLLFCWQYQVLVLDVSYQLFLVINSHPQYVGVAPLGNFFQVKKFLLFFK
jgi:hypothetical protein